MSSSSSPSSYKSLACYFIFSNIEGSDMAEDLKISAHSDEFS